LVALARLLESAAEQSEDSHESHRVFAIDLELIDLVAQMSRLDVLLHKIVIVVQHLGQNI
jgi:hypothetical protein